MNTLNRNTIKDTSSLEIKILQFGEGNFLRAFVDYAFHKLNSAKGKNLGVAVVQPIEHGLVHILNKQDGLYTLFTKGFAGGQVIEEKHLVNNIIKGINPYEEFDEYLDLAKTASLEYIISNTTEAGIAFVETDRLEMSPPTSFPAKLTVFLHKRYQHFNGSTDSGLTIIPCELINYNGDTLKETVLKYADLWHLEEGFKLWIQESNSFHNTLVDRIVPGYPKDELEIYENQLDYKDNLIVTAEHFFLWVIEGDEALKSKLDFSNTGLDVKIVKDMQPYRTRKVRILNGAHTSMVPFGLLCGFETVKETIDDDFAGTFVKNLLYHEIIPTLDLPKEELEQFAGDVLDRFRNPFIKHKLSTIALNSISKFKVRVLPSLLGFYKINGSLPEHITFAFACLLRFYKGSWKDQPTPINDDKAVVEEIAQLWKENDQEEFVNKVLSKEKFWGQDLSTIDGLSTKLNTALGLIESKGVQEGFLQYTKN